MFTTTSRPKRRISSTATTAYMIHSKIPTPSIHYCWSLLVIHTADVLFGGTKKKPPSKECWYVGRHTDDFDWLIFDWLNHVDYTLSYYYRLHPPRQHTIDHIIISRLQNERFVSFTSTPSLTSFMSERFWDIQTRWDKALFCRAPRPAAHNIHVGGDEATAVQHY